MNKLFNKIAIGIASIAMAVGVGVALGSGQKGSTVVKADSYTITFNGSASESTGISTSTTAASITGSSSYVTGNVAAATKAYGATSDGVKLGTSSAAGSIKINLSASGQVTPTSIVVNCKLYSSSKTATLKVNGSATQNVPSSSGNLTFSITSAITYIQLDSSKYIWVKSVTVNYGSSPSKLSTPTGLTASGTTMSWNNVSNNSGYAYSIINTSTSVETTGTTSTNVRELDASTLSLEAGDYTFKVKAKGTGNYTDSDYTSTVNFTISSGGSGSEIVFNNSDSDASTEITNSTGLAYITSGASYVSSLSSISKVYKGTTGLKFGTGSAVGSITINFANNSNLNGKTLFASFMGWGGSNDSSFKFTSSSSLSGSPVTLNKNNSSLAEYEVGTFTSEPSSLTIETTSSVKRGYLKSLRFEELDTQTITASANSAYVGETITVSSNATSTVEWSVVSGSGTTASGAAVTSDGKITVTGAGTVTVKAHATGYQDATKQVTFNAVQDFSINVSVEGASLSGITASDSFSSTSTHGSIYLVPTSGHTMPDDPTSAGLTVTGATLSYSWDNTSESPELGLYVYNATGNITISGSFPEQQGTYYTVSYTGDSNSGHLSSTSDIAANDPLDIYLVPETHYHLPDSITVTMGGDTLVEDTDYTYDGPGDNYPGEITILEVTGDVVISTSCVPDTKYSVTYVAGTHGDGSFTYGTTYFSGESHTLDAFANLSGVDPDSGYKFKDYTVGGQTKAPGDTITISSSNVTVTVNFEETQEHEVTFDFSQLDFTDWTNSYSGQYHDIEYTQGDVIFSDCALPNSDQAIHDIPVTKGGYISFVAADGITISEATFRLRQWTTKTKTVTLYYSTDGGDHFTSTQITSSNFTISDSSLPSGTNAIMIDFTEASNQVGIESLNIVYVGGAAPTTYTITYLANAGDAEGSMSPTTGAAPAVAACSFTREGYSFERWNTQTDGEGDNYSVGTTVSENITLYAIWQQAIEPIGANVTMTGVSGSTPVTVNGHPGIKCGSNGSGGSMTLTLEQDNITKIKVYVAGWNGDSTTVNVSIDEGTISQSSLSLTSDSGISGTSTTYTLNGAETLYVFTLTITNAPKDTDITLYTSAGKQRFVVWGATDLFAETFASEFMTKMTCNNGASTPSFAEGYSWSKFESIYNGLDAQEQGRLHDAQANQGGTQIEQAMARYDYIEGKYNPTNSPSSAWKNFIGRTVKPIGSGRILINMILGDTKTFPMVAIISIVSGLAIGGYFFLRKKKEQ